MMENFQGIPIVDMDPTRGDDMISKELVAAFSDVGFVYVKNIGISQQLVQEAFAQSSNFFQLPLETKMKYRFPTVENKPAYGFVPPEDEWFYEDKPLDLREALDLLKGLDYSLWPQEDILPNFREEVIDFMNLLQAASYRLLHLIGKSLEFKNLANVTDLFEKGDDMQLRMLDYPKISDLSEVKPGQVRCGEHTDYGGLTILFQDSCGGLQVKNRKGEYIDAVPLENTALVNIGDFLAMCTGGKLKSTAHRVLITEENFRKRRQSLAYFCDPDGDKLVDCIAPIGEADKLFSGPISYNMWRNQRFRETNMIQSAQ